MTRIDPELEIASFGRGVTKDRFAAINAVLADWAFGRRHFDGRQPLAQCPLESRKEGMPTSAICQDAAHTEPEARYAAALALLAFRDLAIARWQ